MKSNIKLRKAKESDINWINSKYEEVNFLASNFDNEIIAIAQLDKVDCGVGRLVKLDEQNLELGGLYIFSPYERKGIGGKIVNFLLRKKPNKKATIWCIPFAHLYFFYLKFGFKLVDDSSRKIPAKVLKKLRWAQKNHENEVLLLVRE